MSVFAGLKVLDLSRVLAGPSCGQLLADLGADVIKIEDLQGDENRHWMPVVDGRGANFFSVNRGKRGLTLNLKSDKGKAILAKLVIDADVLIDNFLPATADRLGLNHDRLMAQNSHLIHASITGYGNRGPMTNRPGYDNMLQAFSGQMDMTGEPDGGPCRLGTSVIDLGTGMIAFAGICAALYARIAGVASGQHVEVSLLQTAIAQLGYHFTAYTMAGAVPERAGSAVWHIVPYQAFQTGDGWMLAGANNDPAWKRMAAAMGISGLAEHPDYATAAARVRNRVVLIALLEPLFRQKMNAEWLTILDAANIPCSPVLTMAEAIEHPQVAAMGLVQEVADGRGGTMRLCGPPLSMSGTPMTAGRRPPDLGEHTNEVLAELGMSDGEIEILRQEGIV